MNQSNPLDPSQLIRVILSLTLELFRLNQVQTLTSCSLNKVGLFTANTQQHFSGHFTLSLHYNTWTAVQTPHLTLTTLKNMLFCKKHHCEKTQENCTTPTPQILSCLFPIKYCMSSVLDTFKEVP